MVTYNENALPNTKRLKMKKLILSSLLIGSSLLAEVTAPEVLTKDKFETVEYQLFLTNTKNIPITKDMESKVVFEGGIKKYYEEYNAMIEKRFHLGEETTKAVLSTDSKFFADAAFYKDAASLNNLGIAIVGDIALRALFSAMFGDDTYVQAVDYYQDGKPVTRVLKYLVSDDTLDEEEYKLVFNTTDDQSYHFRTGGFQSTSYKLIYKDEIK